MKTLYKLLLLAMAASIFTACKKENGDPTPDPNATQFLVTTDIQGNPAIKITDRGNGTGTRTLSRDTVYILDNFVFVNSGQTLTIESGTVIKGESGTGTDASALIVARGGKIMADGTADKPIIFTSILDNVSNPLDIPPTNRGLWGGLLILGDARINHPQGELAVEGIPTTETRGLFGGQNDSDNSGILRYISIRHGGSEIGAGNEINGLTLAAVGSGTVVEHVEIFANFDDGIEFFGGTVNVKNAIIAYCGDDALDWDEGYSGSIQYIFVLQANDAGNRGLECNGVNNEATYSYNVLPQAMPIIANGTFIGNNAAASSENELIRLRQASGGKFYNNIFYNFGKGLKIDAVSAEEPIESETRLDNGEIVFKSNLFSKIIDKNTGEVASDIEGVCSESGSIKDKLVQYLINAGNVYSNEIGLTNITNASGGGLNPLPILGGAADLTSPTVVGGIDPVNYIGAFGNENWANKEWTALKKYGFFDE